MLKRAGVLACQQIRELIDRGGIEAETEIDGAQLQPASLDLRLGRIAHRIQASFLPGRHHTVADKLRTFGMTSIELGTGTVLETGCLYLIELQERLKLPKAIGGKANPRSTTGRLDVFTRLMSDRSTAYDHIARGYHGRLYAEVMARTFPIIVREGTSLSQLRLTEGQPVLTDRDLRVLDEKSRLTSRNGEAHAAHILHGIRLRVNLAPNGNGEPVAYRGAQNARIVDLEKRHDTRGFWEPVHSCPDGHLILNPGEFYILTSEERVRVPPDHAAEMVPFDASMGELRVHYAGFFDPGFGWSLSETEGTPAVLEVRAHDTPFVLSHGQDVARLEYSRMQERPERIYGDHIGSTYHNQGLALSKQFRKQEGDPA